ncbi:MAG: site-specific DNA-methyltransferase [Ignavibacteriaceae bacterium]|nr:site-specific DNA-methyltransferase [Ignavibacteriaceae bacterium]
MEDKSVQLIVTSPPYWQLKDYGIENQIGYHEDYETYINNLNLVWKECYRVLDDGCRLCINIGDQFARAVYYGRYKVIPIRTEIIKFCEIIGFDYMGAIIWQKQTTTNTTGGASLMGSFPTPRNGIISIDYEFILIFKKQGQPSSHVTKEMKGSSRLTVDEWREYFSGHWNFGGAKQHGHIAVFPEELPRRLIRMFAFTGETVLDPFLGSGTTSLAAKNLGRNSIGYELNPDYLELIKKKINAAQTDIFDTKYEFLTDTLTINPEEEFSKLKYRFIDCHKLDKKTDPKKFQFGSKIDNKFADREEYFSVKEVITPELLRLSNDQIIRLIGVKAKLGQTEDAKQYLFEKTKGQRVYLKFDTIKYDEKNNLLCYLYLKNKTLINTSIIKARLADVDLGYDYTYKTRFNDLRQST